MIANRFICNWHPYYTPVEEYAKTPLRTFKIEPFKHAKPFAPTETFQRAEEELLDFLLANFRYDAQTSDQLAGWTNTTSISTTSSVASGGVYGAGWTGIYLYDLITENKRPVAMVNRAKAGLRDVADFLLTKIAGYPGRTSVFSSSDFQWGGFEQTGLLTNSAGFYYLLHAAAAGLALLRAYQVHGTASYLDAARAVAWFCRSCQCSGYIANAFTSLDAAGNQRMQPGPHTSVLRNTGSALVPSSDFYPSGLLAVEFLQAFKNVVGDEVIGSSVTGSGAFDFTLSRAATVSTAISDAVSFWTGSGILDSVSGTVVNGFTTSTPLEYFDAYNLAFSATGAWQYNDGSQSTGRNITGVNWALGLRGLYAVQGASSAVTSRFDWLMGFTANPANATPDRASDKTIWQGLTGTFDPKTSLAVTMIAKSPTFTEETAGAYFLGSAGMLAPLYSGRQQASFANLKVALSIPRPFSRSGLEDGRNEYLALMGRCGLSFQPRASTGTSRRRDVFAAAMTGLAYRYAPTGFLGRGRA